MQDPIEQILEHMNSGRFREAGQAIERVLSENPDQVLSHRINLANWLILAANWPLITQLLVPGTNFFVESGWLESMLRERPVNKGGAPIPWYTYPAIEFIEPRIRPDFRVFEYGSGWSTLWWAERTQEVFAVEHDSAWFEQVRGQVPANVRLALQQEPDKYVDQLNACGGDFDVVVVDGENRNECARAAAARTKRSGAIVFDNSDRAAFAEGVRFLDEQGWMRLDFWGLVPCYPYRNCTSIFLRDTRWLSGAPIPWDQSTSIGPSCSQAMGE